MDKERHKCVLYVLCDVCLDKRELIKRLTGAYLISETVVDYRCLANRSVFVILVGRSHHIARAFGDYGTILWETRISSGINLVS